METKPAFSAAVVEVLKQDNYLDWSVRVKTSLMAQGLWDIVESRSGSPTPENVAVLNAMALHVIQNSCGPDTFSDIREITLARIAWETLAGKYKPKGPDPSSSMASVPLEEDNIGPSTEPGESVIEIVENIDDDDRKKFKYIGKALQIGSLNAVREILRDCPVAIRAKITDTGKTALHVAAEAGHVRIVMYLVSQMSAEALEIRDNEGFTALARATCNGKYLLAEFMLGRSGKLIGIQNGIGNIPVVEALYNGHLKMARYLYSRTPREILVPENGIIGATVVCEAIYNKGLDIALDLVERCPDLVFAQDRNGESPFYALACMPDYFLIGNRLGFLRRWIYTGLSSLSRLVSNLQTLLGNKHLCEMKLTDVQSNSLLLLMTDLLSDSSIQEMGTGRVQEAIVRATKEGIFEFVFKMVKAVPSFVWSHDAESRNLFSVAVQYRHAKIFSLIYGLSMKNALASSIDSSNNNLLHMAGMSAPSTSLNDIPGAALKMQRELQWFKEVESIVPPRVHGHLNKEGLTPRQLFTKNHEDMMSKGEKWMKDTASSCTVVGALIVTIMFAAVFTVPGGNDQKNGFPIFLNNKLFLVFIVSDALSLFSSSTSVLMFLGILTSRYAEEDFLESLPRKMIIGLSTLFFSIVAMMITFSAALLLMLHEQSWIFQPVICLASIPIALFVLMQFPLLVAMANSTYGPCIFDRKMKRWF